MTVFIAVSYDDATSLKLNSFYGSPIKYSSDAILASFGNQSNNSITVYESLGQAQAIEGKAYPGAYAHPIFEVELKESCPLEDTADTNKKRNPFKMTPATSIARMVSAIHAGIHYDLSNVWKEREELYAGFRQLWNHPKKQINKDIHQKIENLHTLVASQEGKSPYAELVEIIKMTNQFLDDPSQDNFIKYKALSETKQGALSSRMKAIGVCMFVLSACVFAFAVAATSIPAVGVAVALGGVGLFALGRRGDDVGTVFRDMNDLAAVVSPTQPAMSQ